MRNNIEPLNWKNDLASFGQRNHSRPTRMEVMGPDRNVESDFWLEDGMLLEGIDLETDEDQGPSVEIMLQAPSATTENHMTHSVYDVKSVALESTGGRDEGLEIVDREGTVTILRFEAKEPINR